VENLKRLKKLTIFFVAVVILSGCVNVPRQIGHAKIYYVPPRPALVFEDFGPNCIDDQEFSDLAEWVIFAEKALKKYEAQSKILNKDF